MLFKYLRKPRKATMIPREAKIAKAAKTIPDFINREFLKLAT